MNYFPNNPLISVILPIYNGSEFILQQLDSVLNQTYKNFEIILVDDASSDNSAEIAKEFFKKRKFNNFILSTNPENIGVNKSFEEGIRICHGKYIAICDQDDVWIKDKIEILVKNIEIREVNLVYSQSFLLKNDLFTKKKYPRQNLSTDIFIKLQHNNTRGASMLIRRNFLESILPFSDADIYDKWIYFISVIYESLHFIDTPLDYYRSHSRNVVGTKFRYREKSEVLLRLDSKIKFYNDLLIFLSGKNFKIEEIKASIIIIIEFLENMRNCINSRKISCFQEYLKYVLFKDFFMKEKLIYLYYFLFK